MEQNYTEPIPILAHLPSQFCSSDDDIEEINQKYLEQKYKVYKLYQCLYCKVPVKKSNRRKHNQTSIHIKNETLLRFH